MLMPSRRRDRQATLNGLSPSKDGVIENLLKELLPILQYIREGESCSSLSENRLVLIDVSLTQE